MPYERVPYRLYARIGNPDQCVRCPTASAVVSRCGAAITALRTTYNDPPPYVSRLDKDAWIKESTDAELRATDPEYSQLVTQYEEASAQRDVLKEHCPGGILDHPQTGGSIVRCMYQPPAEGLPAQ